MSGGPRIGITASRDHPVFGVVGDRLTASGYTVSCLDTTHPLPEPTLDQLSAFVPTGIRPGTVRALQRAGTYGVPTWNSPIGVSSSVTRFNALNLLEDAGFKVPDAGTTPPEGAYVARGLYHWSAPGTIGGDGAVYETLLETDRVEYQYHVVDTGDGYRASVVRVNSPLWGEQRAFGTSDPLPEHVDRITGLMEALSMRGIRVDLVRTDGGWYAVALDPGPGFDDAGLEAAIGTSIEALL